MSLAFSEKLIPLFEAHLSLLELAPDAASSRAGRRGDGKSLIEVAKDAGITNIDSISLFKPVAPLYLPAGHGLHVFDVCCVTLPYLPASQAVHEADPVVA